MRAPLIIANWKMNPATRREAVSLASRVRTGIQKIRSAAVVIAPPALFLEALHSADKKLKLCAQDIFWEAAGPYTGAVSWRHLNDFGVRYVIIGHSERRIYFGETDEMVHKKLSAVLLHGFTAVLCVGERERQENEIAPIVGEQLLRAVRDIPPRFLKKLVVAYEPVWAISTNPGAKPDTSENAFRARVFIKKVLTKMFGNTAAGNVRIIYGGSVKSGNIASFIRDGKMEGALVGRASLDAEEFIRIVAIAGRAVH